MGSASISGAFSPAMSTSQASAILESREREKKDLQDLNDRLASYIEKVRFLEAQNRKLANDLEALRNRQGKDTFSIKSMYEIEIGQARKVADETAKAKADMEAELDKLQKDLRDLNRKYEDSVRARDGEGEKLDGLMSQLSDAEAQIGLMRRRIGQLEDEVARLKKENFRLQSELSKARADLDQETLNRIDYQNQVQALEEELDFLRRVHDQEIKELQSLAVRDTTAENREFFKNELASAIRDIRTEYDVVQTQNKTDMESWYKLKVQEIQTASVRQNMESGYQREEAKRLRVQLGDLRGKLGDLESKNAMLEKQVQELSYQLEDDHNSYESALGDRDTQIRKMREECQALMVELQMLLDTKQTLDAEIAIYRKMLDGEDDKEGLKQLVDQIVRTHSSHHSADVEKTRVLKGETSTRSSFQRSAKGNISISECNPDGKFITLENTHRTKDENLGDWQLKRKIDGRKEIVFTLPTKLVVKAGKSVKIWAAGAGGTNNPPEQLVFEGEASWGIGKNVETILYNKDGEERATHIQRTT
jgi:intermediate filament protein if